MFMFVLMGLATLKGCTHEAMHYGVERGQVAQVFFVTEIGTIQLNKTPFTVIYFWKCHLVGFNPFDKIQLSLSYLGNSLDKFTSQGIRNCKICFKLWKAVFQGQPWCQDPSLHIMKPSGFTLNCSHQSKYAFSQGHTYRVVFFNWTPPKFSKYRIPCKLAWNFSKCQQS